MLTVDLNTRAEVVIIPPEPGHAAATVCRDVSVASAIRYVVEQLPRHERSRAVVRTSTALLFINEVEALYDRSEFPKHARNRAGNSHGDRETRPASGGPPGVEPQGGLGVTATMQTPASRAAPVVLIVEDEPLVRLLGADVLEDAGFEVIEAMDADQAFALLKRHHDIRVVWTDVDMPGSLNGFEFARLVGQGWPEITVLVTSGKMSPGPGDLPRRGTFIPKPYRPEAVVRYIREMTQAA